LQMPVVSTNSTAAAMAGRRAGDRCLGWLTCGAAVVVLGCLLLIPLWLVVTLLSSATMPVPDAARLGRLAADGLRATACALLVAVPLGFASAAFTAGFCAARLRGALRTLFELFAAVPTVVLGLVATASLAPWLAGHVATVLEI